MFPKILTTYLQWGHRNNRIALALILSASMSISIIFQGLDFFDTINKEQVTLSKQKPLIEKHSKKLTEKDFKLLFGQGTTTQKNEISSNIPETSLKLVLAGVLSTTNGQTDDQSSVIIQEGGEDRLFGIGESIAPGIVLREIYKDHVVLDRNGQLEKLYFPTAKSDTGSLHEYQHNSSKTEDSPENGPGFARQPDGKSLNERMQDLRTKLQEANPEL